MSCSQVCGCCRSLAALCYALHRCRSVPCSSSDDLFRVLTPDCIHSSDPESSECGHSIDCGYSHPEALNVAYQWSPVPGTLSALLSQGTTSLSRVGYLLGLYLVQASSSLCECVYVVDMESQVLRVPQPLTSRSVGPHHLETLDHALLMLSGPYMHCGPSLLLSLSTGHQDLAPCQSMDQDPETVSR